MTKHFNNLTPAQAELLAMLSEECGEIVQIVGKIQRHGYDSYHPNDTQRITNRRLLEAEISDLKAICLAMIRGGDISEESVNLEDILARKMKWTHHQSGLL